MITAHPLGAWMIGFLEQKLVRFEAVKVWGKKLQDTLTSCNTLALPTAEGMLKEGGDLIIPQQAKWSDVCVTLNHILANSDSEFQKLHVSEIEVIKSRMFELAKRVVDVALRGFQTKAPTLKKFVDYMMNRLSPSKDSDLTKEAQILVLLKLLLTLARSLLFGLIHIKIKNGIYLCDIFNKKDFISSIWIKKYWIHQTNKQYGNQHVAKDGSNAFNCLRYCSSHQHFTVQCETCSEGVWVWGMC